ncbi:MAG TPA: hypothetical protein VGM32_17390 [Rhodopila sp.]
MLRTFKPLDINRSITLSTVRGLAVPGWATIPAWQSGDEFEDDIHPDDVAESSRFPRKAGSASYYTALLIAAALLFTWLGLRAL